MLMRLVATGVLFCAALAAQVKLTQVKLFIDGPARVRPLQSIAVQVRAYGENGAAKGRLPRTAPIKVVTENGGWLSKPFVYQGIDNEVPLQEKKGLFGAILASVANRVISQNAQLYTAPAIPGKYKLETTLEGQTASLEIEVTTDAVAPPPETTNFDPRPREGEAYRALAEHWAPVLAQETWFQPKSDFPVRFDYDGDWDGGNNWDNLDRGSSQAYVHYAAMETDTHWFLNYNVFHARDYSDRCVVGTCHENDNEGVILTIAKNGTEYGELQVMETLAHNVVFSYTNDPRIRAGFHTIDGGIGLADGHPIVFIEAGGHGILGGRSNQSLYDEATGKFQATGVTFVYKGVAERPTHSMDSRVGYDLIPILTEWWPKGCQTAEPNTLLLRIFDEFFRYSPFSDRPKGTCHTLSGAFWGRKQAANKARPFWGWFDSAALKRKVLATGQWGLDPAYAVSRNVIFAPEIPFSLTYIHNPYLGIP